MKRLLLKTALAMCLSQFVSFAALAEKDQCLRLLNANSYIVIPPGYYLTAGADLVVLHRTGQALEVLTQDMTATLDGKSCTTQSQTSVDMIADWIMKSKATYDQEVSDLNAEISQVKNHLKDVTFSQSDLGKWNKQGLLETEQELAEVRSNYSKFISACSRSNIEKIKEAAQKLDQQLNLKNSQTATIKVTP